MEKALKNGQFQLELIFFINPPEFYEKLNEPTFVDRTRYRGTPPSDSSTTSDKSRSNSSRNLIQLKRLDTTNILLSVKL
jgi:hypothetical protein